MRHGVLWISWIIGALVTGDARAADGVKVLTFIEARSGSVAECKQSLLHYSASLAQRADTARVEILQDIDRPERFVILETTDQSQELASAEAASAQILAAAQNSLVAPPDRRTHREFADSAASNPSAPHAQAAAASRPPPSTAVYVITHVDIGPPDRAKGESALRKVAADARRTAGNLVFEIWQQTDRGNHFNVVAAWSSQQNLDDFTAGADARVFRTTVAPLIGSLYDDRLLRRIN